MAGIPAKDFTIPIDKDGQVIYFSLNHKRFFFNGHSGFFSDSLPEYAHDIFSALIQPEHRREKTFLACRNRYGPECESLIKEIRLFQEGTHLHLRTEPRQQGFLKRRNPQTITVYLSQGCNLACRYCFNQGGSPGEKPSFMSMQTAGHTLDFIADIVKTGGHEAVTVFLFGGEPLLNPEATFFLARGLHDLNQDRNGTRVRLILSTNGTIYHRDIFHVIREYPDLSRVAVSLDGNRETQDKNRPFAGSDKGSYDSVIHTLKRIIAEKVPHSVSCMVPYPFDFVQASKNLHNLPIDRLEIKQLNHLTLGKPDLPRVFKRDFEIWRKNYIVYSDYCVDYLGSSDPVKHLDRWSIPSSYAARLAQPEGSYTSLACQMGDAVLAIDTMGRLLPCDIFLNYPPFYLGGVKTGFDRSKYAHFEEWLLAKGQYRIDNPRCKTCFAKRLCGGGCYAENLHRSGYISLKTVSPDAGAAQEPIALPIKEENLPELDEISCAYMKETVKINLYFISQVRKLQPEAFALMAGKTDE